MCTIWKLKQKQLCFMRYARGQQRFMCGSIRGREKRHLSAHTSTNDQHESIAMQPPLSPVSESMCIESRDLLLIVCQASLPSLQYCRFESLRLRLHKRGRKKAFVTTGTGMEWESALQCIQGHSANCLSSFTFITSLLLFWILAAAWEREKRGICHHHWHWHGVRESMCIAMHPSAFKLMFVKLHCLPFLLVSFLSERDLKMHLSWPAPQCKFCILYFVLTTEAQKKVRVNINLNASIWETIN